MKKLLIFVLLLAVFTPAQAQSNILYATPNGSGSSTCSITNPCTFQRAHDLAGTGSVIQLVGTFPSILITKSGVTVRAAVLGDAVIDGSISGSHSRCLRVNDSNTFADNVVIENLVVRNCDSHGIIVRNSDGSIIRGNYVHDSVLERLRGEGWGSCIKGERGATNLLIENNRVERCNGEGIAVTMVGGATIRNNEVVNSYSVLLYIDNSYDVLSHDNILTCTGDAQFLRNGSRAKGITIGEESYSGWGAQLRDVSIIENTVTDCSTGIMAFQSDVGGTLTDVLIDNNIIPSGTKLPLSIDASKCSNVVVSNNRIWINNIWVRCAGVILSGNVLYTDAPTNTPIVKTPTPVPTNTPVIKTPTNTPVIATAHPPTPTLTPTVRPTETAMPECELLYEFDNGQTLWLCP
jgi:parallel beta-helix repeat protein